MKCVYDGNEAIGLDLCHASHPICAEHIGHQLAPLPKPEPKAAAKK